MEIWRLPARPHPVKGLAALAGAVAILGLTVSHAYDLRESEDEIAALLAIGFLICGVLLETGFYFRDRRDWLVFDPAGLSMPRYFAEPLPRQQITGVELIPSRSGRDLVRITLVRPTRLTFRRPVLCPRALKQTVGTLVISRPHLLGVTGEELANELRQRIEAGALTYEREMVLAHKPQNAQGSLAGLGIAFGLAMIATAMLRSI